jgi:hypothetical protein
MFTGMAVFFSPKRHQRHETPPQVFYVRSDTAHEPFPRLVIANEVRRSIYEKAQSWIAALRLQ